MSAPIPVGNFAAMEGMAMPGDYLFFWDKNPIAYAIEEITAQVVAGHKELAPSHVILTAQLPPFSPQMFEIESVFAFGCRMLPLSHYSSYKSRMLLCRRVGITQTDVTAAIGVALEYLGRQYEVTEEIQIAAHKLFPWLPIETTQNELFCSALLQASMASTSVPFATPPQGNATPMWCLNDKLTQPMMWVN
jgi:hypothetical protein